MIIEWLISTGTAIATWFETLLPSFDVPEWFGQLGGNINKFFDAGAGLEPFVDWTFLGIIAAVPLGLWASGLLFKLARMLLSHIPFVGGR